MEMLEKSNLSANANHNSSLDTLSGPTIKEELNAKTSLKPGDPKYTEKNSDGCLRTL
jgi:hypothetical protein